MSDRTTDKLAVSDSEPAEPSMEDILASIRRIIADDSDATTDTLAPQARNTNEPHTDIRDLAAIHPAEADQNTVLVEADPALDDMLELEDILVLSDDDFSADDLEIPAISIPVDDIDDDIFSSDETSLQAEIANMFDEGSDLTLTEAEATPVQSIVMPSPDVVEPVGDNNQPDQMFEIDILSELADDIDLILDDGGDEIISPEMSTSDGLQVLGIVEAGIADIESRVSPAPIESAQIPDVVVVDTPTDSHDAFGSIFAESSEMELPENGEEIDLMGDLLDTSDKEPLFEISDMPKTDESQPIEVEFPNVDREVVTGDEDIDLVKSLMAELTDESFLDVPVAVETEPERDTEDTQVVTSDPETEFLDDILDLAMADEIALAAPESAKPLELNPAVDVVEIAPASVSPAVDLTEFEPVTLSPAEAVDVEPVGSPEETATADNEAVDSVDASINALLEIAALAERDADTVEEVFTAQAEPEVLEAKEDIPSPVSAVEALAPVEDVDTPLTPEFDTDFDDIDAIFASDIDLESSVTADDIETTTIDSILPEMSDTADLVDDYAEEIAIPKYAVPDDVIDDIFNDDADAETEDSEAALSAIETLAAEPIEPLPTLEQEPSEMPKLVAKDGIIDNLTESAAAEAFASLNQIVEENTEYQESGPRIGDLVQEALRPMLKDWLDANLKGIVERAVTKEVKRISSGK